MAEYLQVKNWEEFQHYKDRRPPWIKVHRELLDDYTFMSLSRASRGDLMQLWIIASENDGKIKDDEDEIRFRLNIPTKVPVLQPLIDAGFLVRLQDASEALATCGQLAIPEGEVEGETEGEGEQDEELPAPPPDRLLRLIPVKNIPPSRGWTHGEGLWPFTEGVLKRLHNTHGRYLEVNYPCLQAFDHLEKEHVDLKTYRGMYAYLARWIKKDLKEGNGLPPISWEKTINAKKTGG